jgi:tRNA(Arg) A34 adenosine deaminase TadA
MHKKFDFLHQIATKLKPVAQKNVRVAAGIWIKKDLISLGFAQMKSHPFQSRFGVNSDAIFLHAETDAIRNALNVIDVDDLALASLYVCRVRRDGIRGLAKPCIGCHRAIATFNLKNTYYSLSDSFECECL